MSYARLLLLKIKLQRLYERLGYTFNDYAYLKQALTHRSAGPENNERYEFVGDSVLNFIIAHVLFENFPNCTEGELSRLRSYLVRGDMLSEIANEIGLSDYLYLGQGELKSGGFRRASILADTLEAVFAAVFFEGGIEAAKTVIFKLYSSRLHDKTLLNAIKDAKTVLQETLQSKKRALPMYTLIKIEGNEHDQMFYVTCTVPGMKQITEGQGVTRRKAEQMAAALFLEKLV
jgi:ribonuclease-3